MSTYYELNPDKDELSCDICGVKNKDPTECILCNTNVIDNSFCSDCEQNLVKTYSYLNKNSINEVFKNLIEANKIYNTDIMESCRICKKCNKNPQVILNEEKGCYEFIPEPPIIPRPTPQQLWSIILEQME
jgi:hypothetical protein